MTQPAAGFIEPAYHQRSLGDVLPAIADALGADRTTHSGLILPDAQAYVLLLVDGLGQRLLDRYAHAAPFLSSLMGAPGTAGVPSTTATSLTSLGTGLDPGQHGLVGYTARVPETGERLNHLQWDLDVDPLAWQPHDTAFARLARLGVEVSTINKRAFSTSGLTVSGQRGAAYVGADNAAERLEAALAGAGRAPSLTYLYDSDLDRTGHLHGVASTEWLLELQAVDAFAEELREKLPGSVRLVVIADHGMVDSPSESRIELDHLPHLHDGLSLVAGEARFRHLYCRPGATDDVVAAWRAELGERAEVLTRDEGMARGWFGTVESRVAPRLGDVLVACHGDTAVFSTADFPHEQLMVGLHGSLTPDEMVIPILVA